MNLSSLKNHLINTRGWRTNQKIVVIESDDWGAVRTSNTSALKVLEKMGVHVQKCHYTMFDALASEDDLDSLFSVLLSVKDSQGKNARLTANSLVANPDFKKIKENKCQNYYGEDFRKTLNRYPNHAKSFDLWKDGMANSIFHPQFHGREHLNISRWMKALHNNDEITNKAFDFGIYGISGHIVPKQRGSHLAAFDGGKKELIYDRAEIVKGGLHKFKEIFGYSSESMIAPNYVWDNEIEKAASQSGVKYFQTSTTQRISKDFGEKQQIIRHHTGKKNRFNQLYMMRNCYFEPSSKPNKDWVDSCLRDIKTAFTMHKPAIISTHRVNFVGFIDEKNRNRNLPKFQNLLKQIVKKWPDVIFMSSDELGNYITTKKLA
jgi:intracellular sulfur oxidation DsrE/DsrF family protein